MKSYGCCDHLEGFWKNLRSKINQVWARFCLSFISEHPVLVKRSWFLNAIAFLDLGYGSQLVRVISLLFRLFDVCSQTIETKIIFFILLIPKSNLKIKVSNFWHFHPFLLIRFVPHFFFLILWSERSPDRIEGGITLGYNNEPFIHLLQCMSRP